VNPTRQAHRRGWTTPRKLATACAVVQRGGGEATECGGTVGRDMYKAAVEYVTPLCRKREEPPKGADVA